MGKRGVSALCTLTDLGMSVALEMVDRSMERRVRLGV